MEHGWIIPARSDVPPRRRIQTVPVCGDNDDAYNKRVREEAET